MPFWLKIDPDWPIWSPTQPTLVIRGGLGANPLVFVCHALTSSLIPSRSMKHSLRAMWLCAGSSRCARRRAGAAARDLGCSWCAWVKWWSGHVSGDSFWFAIILFSICSWSISPVIIRPLIICDINRPQIQRHFIQGLSVHLVDRPIDRTMWLINSPFYPRRWGEKRCSACSSVVVLVITCTFGTLIDIYIYIIKII